MKTKIQLKLAVVATILLSFIMLAGFTPVKTSVKDGDPVTKASKPAMKEAVTWPCGSMFTISNTTPCDLAVTYTIYCNGSPCYMTPAQVTLSTGATFNILSSQIACAASCNFCDIQVRFIRPGVGVLGTVSGASPTATWSNGFCSGVGTSTIVWTSNNATI